MSPIPSLRFATFLSPVLYETYEQISRYVGETVGLPITFHVGQSLTEFEEGQTDIAFLCGLLYVNMCHWPSNPVELLAAPIVARERYGQRPIYFSDVVVRRESRITSFADLQGCTWAYNETASHSGYNVVRYSLLTRGTSFDYFGTLLETGSHRASLQAVLDGTTDATALDSHMLDVLLSHNSDIAAQIRIIDSFGPSAIPPLVISKRIDTPLKQRIQATLYTMHRYPHAACGLQHGLIERLVPIQDEAYDDIRAMLNVVNMPH